MIEWLLDWVHVIAVVVICIAAVTWYVHSGASLLAELSETLAPRTDDVSTLAANTFWRGTNGRKVLLMGSVTEIADGELMVSLEDILTGHVGTVSADGFLKNYRRIIEDY